MRSEKRPPFKSPNHIPKKKEMMSFLGMANFCRAWIANYATEVAPLSDLIYGSLMSAKDSIQWNVQAEDAFTKIKHLIVGYA